MARYTPAYTSLVGRLKEVEILYRAAGADERKDPIGLRNQINALCRGAIVLLSSHLEAYVKELGEVTLTAVQLKSVIRNSIASQFFYHISKDFIVEIKNTSDPAKIADKIFAFLNTDNEFWARSGHFPNPLPVDRFNKGFSNPAYQKIDHYLKRFGYTSYQADLARELRANYNSTVNMVDHLVDTRNKIAHGDPLTTKTPSDVREMTRVIKEYSRVTDSLFAIWCRDNLCAIRRAP
jgi:hypothetical protein